MSGEGVQELDAAFVDHVRGLAAAAPARRAGGDDPLVAGGRLTCAQAIALLDAQMTSRHLDAAARAMRARNQGFYTIGSAGHEGNAAVAAALRPTDPAFLHYRSGAFFVHRAAQLPGQHPALDILLGIAASRDEPIAGGRHKVYGSRPLWIPPQTSTIASHLPKAVGMGFALERGRRLGALPDDAPPADAIVMCSFGDASVNHSTAVGALNAACRIAMHLPVPVLFVCEDNGLGISVKTPPGWIEKAWGNRPNLMYVAADGLDLDDAFAGAARAADHVRATRRPAFLHLRTVRFWAHAGSDVELTYRTREEIVADYPRDPLRRSAELLVAAGALTPAEILERWEAIRAEVAGLADQAAARPKLRDAADVMAPLAPRSAEDVAVEVARTIDAEPRARFWDGRLPEDGKPVPLAAHINAALGDLLVKYPRMLIFGEDVGRKGGVYGVTKTLDRRAGVARVFDTILDEQTILGLAIGAGHAGLLPVPEIQYLAYLHNAEDQLRGEAASLQFFSQGQFKNPMVIRIAGYGYQKGFGGHFHNDDAVAVLRDIPGIVVASPSRGDDAAAMLRTCVAAAAVDGSVCVFLEPIALYATRDLHDDGDGLWQTPYDPAGPHAPIGRARVHGDGDQLLLVSFANGVPMALRAARRLERDSGRRCRVLDLRWLSPLPEDDLLREANRVGKVLIVDETRRSGGISEGVLACLIDGGFRGPMARVTSKDSFIPLGAAANHVLLSEDEIVDAALRL